MVAIAALHFATSGLTLFLAAVSWRRPKIRAARQLAPLMLALAWWTALEAVVKLVPGLDAKLLVTQIQYIGLALSAPLFLRFTLAYSGTDNHLARGISALVWFVCVATIAVECTNGLHGLFWRRVALDATATLLVPTRGLWFWVFVAGTYLALLSGTIAVAGLVLRTGRGLRRQAVVVLAATLLPWAGNALYVTDALSLPGLDPTPIAFSLTGLLVAFAILRLDFLALVPVARGAVVDTMSDGVLVLDTEARLVDHNPAAAALASIAAPRHGSPSLPEGLSRVLSRNGAELQDEIVLEVDGHERVVELRAWPFATRSGKPLGRLVVLRDITERRAAERERERLLADLRNASAEISTLQGLLPICSSCKSVRDDSGYWNQIEIYISKHADVRFSHGLCPDCAHELYPEIFEKKPPGA
jgi:PAS domain-containing protein